MTMASAPGKLILCGEHAVVYGQPAIALPLPDVRATATVESAARDSGVVCELPDIAERWTLRDYAEQPLGRLVELVARRAGLAAPGDLRITLRSAIPIASGMGSGAALGAALVRALAAHWQLAIDPSEVARLVYESERVYHGTPSGIDNTVVSYERAIWFVRGQTPESPPTIEPVQIGAPLDLLIGDTGVRAPTFVTVGGVRERWQRDREAYNRLFDAIGAVVREVRRLLEQGDQRRLGAALDHNQALLARLGVSSPELERLIGAARDAGALGAKLSGGGGGGIMLALVERDRRDQVERALLHAGAARVTAAIVT